MYNLSEQPPLVDLNLVFTVIYENLHKDNSSDSIYTNPVGQSFTKIVEFTAKRLGDLLE